MNYPTKWRQWITACISNIQYSIIINEPPKGPIKPKRGFRQGNPISPFIFVLAMDYLSALLNHLRSFKGIQGLTFNDRCRLNHFLFADDILIFVENDAATITNLRFVLDLFKTGSSLTINRNKSTISPINTSEPRVTLVASQ